MAAQTDAQLAASPAAQFAAQLAAQLTAQLARSGFPAGCSVKRLSYQLGKLQAACVFLAWLSFPPKKQQEARHKASFNCKVGAGQIHEIRSQHRAEVYLRIRGYEVSFGISFGFGLKLSFA